MKKYFVALPIVAVLLTGCSTAAPVAGAPSTAVEQSAAGQEAKTTDRSAELGGTVTYDDGVTVTVSSLGFAPAGEYAVNAVEGQAAIFELAVTNGSDKELNAALMSMPKVTTGDKNTNAESVIDSENNIGMDMLSTILPGETQAVKFAAGIAAADAGVVRVEVSGPGLMDKAAIFKGAVK